MKQNSGGGGGTCHTPGVPCREGVAVPWGYCRGYAGGNGLHGLSQGTRFRRGGGAGDTRPGAHGGCPSASLPRRRRRCPTLSHSPARAPAPNDVGHGPQGPRITAAASLGGALWPCGMGDGQGPQALISGVPLCRVKRGGGAEGASAGCAPLPPRPPIAALPLPLGARPLHSSGSASTALPQRIGGGGGAWQ